MNRDERRGEERGKRKEKQGEKRVEQRENKGEKQKSVLLGHRILIYNMLLLSRVLSLTVISRLAQPLDVSAFKYRTLATTFNLRTVELLMPPSAQANA